MLKLTGPGTYEMEVVGESHYQKELNEICGERSADGKHIRVEAALVLEKGNRYDRNAVRVDISGKTVGYLRREIAALLRKQFKQDGLREEAVAVDALIQGGFELDEGGFANYGVRIDLGQEEA